MEQFRAGAYERVKQYPYLCIPHSRLTRDRGPQDRLTEHYILEREIRNIKDVEKEFRLYILPRPPELLEQAGPVGVPLDFVMAEPQKNLFIPKEDRVFDLNRFEFYPPRLESGQRRRFVTMEVKPGGDGNQYLPGEMYQYVKSEKHDIKLYHWDLEDPKPFCLCLTFKFEYLGEPDGPSEPNYFPNAAIEPSALYYRPAHEENGTRS